MLRGIRHSLWESLGGRPDDPAAAASDRRVEDLVEIEFSPDAGGEAELSEMLGSVVLARRCDPELWEEVFGAFCSRFCSEFADWWPDDAPLRPARIAAAEALAKGGTPKPQVVVGCRAGHPRELLRCLVEAIGGLSRRPTDGSRTDSRYCDALQTVLKALRVACRSRHNQAALLAMNLGEEMQRPIDLLAAQLSSGRRQAHSRVGDAAAYHGEGSGGGSGGAGAGGVVPPRWLEPILASYLEVLSDLSRSTWTKESDVRLSPSRAFTPLTARRLAVWASDGREPSRLFNAVLDALLLYLESLTPEDDSSRSGIAVDLLKLLPTVDVDPSVAIDPVAVLTAVGCCISCNVPGSLEMLMEAGLEDRLTGALAFWYSTRPATHLEAIHEIILTCWFGLHDDGLQAEDPPPSDGQPASSARDSPALLRSVLRAMLRSADLLAMSGADASCLDCLHDSVLELLVVLVGPRPLEPGAPLRLTKRQEARLEVIRNAGIWIFVLDRDTAVRALVRAAAAVDDVSGLVDPARSSTSGTSTREATPSLSPSLRTPSVSASPPPPPRLRRAAKRHPLLLLPATTLVASVAAAAENGSREVSVVLDLLDTEVEDGPFAAELCGLLHAAIDWGCSSKTAATLASPESVVPVCRMLTRFRIPDPPADPEEAGPEGLPPRLDDPYSWIRNVEAAGWAGHPAIAAAAGDPCATGLVAFSFVALALRESPVARRAAALSKEVPEACIVYSFARELRRPALRLFALLATVQPVTEEDMVRKTALTSKLVEMLTMALGAWRDGASPGIVLDIIVAMGYVASARKPMHQLLLSRAQCFTHLLHLLSADAIRPGTALARRMCLAVLSALRALCEGCRDSRRQLRESVGYAVLQRAIRHALGDEPPSADLLARMLELVLEEDVAGLDAAPRATTVVGDALPLFFDLLRAAPRPLMLQCLELWSDVVSRSMPAVIATQSSGVMGVAISWLKGSQADAELATVLLSLIRRLGAHSISAEELGTLFDMLRTDEEGHEGPVHDQVLEALSDMFAGSDPAAFFHSDPDDPRTPSGQGGGVHARIAPHAARIPSAGLSFTVWARAMPEERLDGHSARVLLSCCTVPDSSGASRALVVALARESLLVYSWAPALAVHELRVGSLMEHGWHHLAVIHVPGGAMSPPQLKLYLDGRHEATARIKYPGSRLSLSGFALGAPCVGLPDLPAPHVLRPWVGQLGAAHFFADPLQPEKILALYALGPSFQSAPSALVSDWALDQNPSAAATVVHGMSVPQVVLLISAEACVRGTSDKHAVRCDLLPGTHVCLVTSAGSMLHCLGGIEIVLPLFLQVANDEVAEPAKRAARVLKLLRSALAGDASHIPSFVERCGGCAAVARILANAPSEVLGPEVVEEAEEFAAAMVSKSPELAADVRRHVLLNIRLWSAAEAATQERVIELCHCALNNGIEEVSETPSPQAVLGLVHEVFAPKLASARTGSLREGDVGSLRRSYLELARTMLLSLQTDGEQGRVSSDLKQKINSIYEESTMSLVSLALGGPSVLPRASEDAAACLCQLLALESPTRGPAVAALGRSGGQKLFVPLLSSESSVQRVHGLRLLALTSDSGSDTLLGPVLRATLSRDPVPTAMRLALEELLCGGVSWSNIEQACATGAPPAIVVPSVAQVLLSNSLRNPEDGAASIELLRALTTVPANCDALLSVDGFFPLLLSLVRQADPRQPSSSPRLSPASIAEEEGDVSDGLSREVLRRLFDRALVACRDFRRLLPTVVQSLIRGGDAARYCLRIPSNPVDHLVYGRWEIFLCELLAEGLADASRSLQNAFRASEDGWTVVSLWDSDVFARNVACLFGLIEDVLSGVVLARASRDRCDVTAVDTTLLGLWTEGLLSGVQGATRWSFYPAPLPRAVLRFAVTDLSSPASVNAIRDVRIADVQGGNLAAAARPARAVLRVMLGAVAHADPTHLRVEVFPALARIAQSGIFRPQHYSIAVECLSQLAVRSHAEGDQERVALAGEATRVLMEHDPREPISKSTIEPFGEFERLRRSSSAGDLDARLAETDWAEMSERVISASRKAAEREQQIDRDRRRSARVLQIDSEQAAAVTLRDAMRSVMQWPNFWAVEEKELHWKLDPAEDLSRRRFRLRRKYHFVVYDDAIDDSTPEASRQQSISSERTEGTSPPPPPASGTAVASPSKATSVEATDEGEAAVWRRPSIASSRQDSLMLDLSELSALADGRGVSPPACPPPSAAGSAATGRRTTTPAASTHRSVTFAPTGSRLGSRAYTPTGENSPRASAGDEDKPAGPERPDPVTPDGTDSGGAAPVSATVEPSPRELDAQASCVDGERTGDAAAKASSAASDRPASPAAPLRRSFEADEDAGGASPAVVAGLSAGSVALPSGEPSLGENASEEALSSAFEAMSHTSFSPATTPRAAPQRSPAQPKPISRVPSLVSPTRRSLLAHGEDLKGLRRAMSAVLMLTRQDMVSVSAALVDDDSVSRRLHKRLGEDLPSSPLGASAQTSSPPVYGTLHSSPANWIRPGGVWRGELFMTSEHFHFAGYELQEGSQGGTPRKVADARKQAPEISRRWPLSGIREVHHSRYLLQPSALELFMSDRRSHAMFSFPSAQLRREFLAALGKHCPHVEFFDRDRKMDMALKLQQQWLHWNLSNFDYIMALNTLAGRTYNDLNQYPVFPWVLSDYSSDEIDLNDPASYRDLSKPMGALDEDRLEFFEERYRSLVGDTEVPPFHYGTHYSSAASVLFYLIRLEPFTKYNRQLQGGHFDHADRLFHSVLTSWNSCLHNTSDVKELVPEFYYNPEFLRNSNGFHLGRRQDGTALDDVVLPPWARGSADEFVRIMREALESVHVSAHLHEWIDLIFGIKQRGRFAEQSHNVFFHLTYEGSVVMDSIADPLQRSAVEDQIRHFGQVPIQLFRRHHPQRSRPPPPAAAPLLNGPDSFRVVASLTSSSQGSAPTPGIVYVNLLGGGRVLSINRQGVMFLHRWIPPTSEASSFTFSTADSEATCAPLSEAGSVQALPVLELEDRTTYAAFSRRYCCVHDGHAVVLCCDDGSLVVHAVPEAAQLQRCRYHRSRATCVAASSDGLWVVSGSEDTTVLVWACNKEFKPKRSGLALGRSRSSALPIVRRPVRELHGHHSSVCCVAVSHELDAVVSGGGNGLVLVHSLGTGACCRAFSLPGNVAPDLLSLVPESGQIVLHSYADLAVHLATLTGRLLVSHEVFDRLADMRVAAGGRLLLTAGSSGRVMLRWLHSLGRVMVFDAEMGPITALHVSKDQTFVAGFQSGSLAVFSPDPRRHITHRFNLANVRESQLPGELRRDPSTRLLRQSSVRGAIAASASKTSSAELLASPIPRAGPS